MFCLTFSIMFCLILWTLHPVAVLAYSSYQSRVPNGNNFGGHTGHISSSGGGQRNSFGLAFHAAGKIWTKALCEADSDGDSYPNGVELGDPCCVFTEGASD